VVVVSEGASHSSSAKVAESAMTYNTLIHPFNNMTLPISLFFNKDGMLRRSSLDQSFTKVMQYESGQLNVV
jgi:hypothetical protein